MADQEKDTKDTIGGRGPKKGHMSFLFFSLLALILVTPLMRSDMPGHAVISLAFIAILISGVHAVSDNLRHGVIALALGLPLIIGYVVSEFVPTRIDTSAVVLTLGIPFFLFVTYRLLMFVVHATKVGKDELFASASAYLMFGFSWAGVYGLVEYFQPGSFTNIGLAADAVWDTLFYFSFVTLTTLGYGDIAPITPFTRHLAILEAITGVLTLSFLISRLVSLYKKED